MHRISSELPLKGNPNQKYLAKSQRLVWLGWFSIMRDAYQAPLLNRSFLRFAADARIERLARSGNWRRRFSWVLVGKRKCEASSEDSSELSAHQMLVRAELSLNVCPRQVRRSPPGKPGRSNWTIPPRWEGDASSKSRERLLKQRHRSNEPRCRGVGTPRLTEPLTTSFQTVGQL